MMKSTKQAKVLLSIVAIALVVCLVATATTQAGTISMNDVRNYWGAEDGSGTNVADSVGSMDATLKSSTSGTLPTYSSTSKVGSYALQFNSGFHGVMDANAAYSSSLGENGFSYSCWFRADEVQYYGRMFTTAGSDTAGKGLSIYTNNGATGDVDGNPTTIGIDLDYTVTEGFLPVQHAADTITIGDWMHMTVTRSAKYWSDDLDDFVTDVNLFLNGTQVAGGTEKVVDSTLLIGNQYRYYELASKYDREFGGLIDEMVLFNREFTGAEVQEFYGLGGEVGNLPVPEPSTLALLVCGLAGLLCYAWKKRK